MMERLTYRHSENKKVVCVNKSITDVLVKLAEYEDAEEQGLLLRLPCKIGDKAYVIVNKTRVYEMEVMGIYPFGALYDDEDLEIRRVYNIYLDGNVYYKHCTFYDIGKTVFLTKEEAEKALEDMKGGAV